MIPLIALIAAVTPPGAPGRVATVAEGQGFAGMVLLAEGGKVTLEQGFGRKSPTAQRRAREKSDFLASDHWRWSSVTKQVVATLAMQDVAAGRLALDAPITRYLPGFRGPTGNRITVAMLLGHESGLPDSNANDSAAFRPGYRGSLDALTGLCAGPVRDQPGASFFYDNCDYIVAGRLLEAVNRQPLANLLATRITRPLGMASVTWAGPHVPGAGEAPVNVAAYGAAAAITGTVRDLWRFDQALIDGKLLPKAQRDLMWDGKPAKGFAALGQWAFRVSLRGCKADQLLIERRGNVGNVQVRNYILPERNIVLIAMTNRDTIDFGELWQGAGLGYQLLSAAACNVDA
jgi:CubicO group peptidase (beta-lactamase class C family)